MDQIQLFKCPDQTQIDSSLMAPCCDLAMNSMAIAILLLKSQ